MQMQPTSDVPLDAWYNTCEERHRPTLPAAVPTAHRFGLPRKYIALRWVGNFVYVQGPSIGDDLALPAPHLLCMFANDGFCSQEFQGQDAMKPCKRNRHEHRIGACDICANPVPLSVGRVNSRKGMCMNCVYAHKQIQAAPKVFKVLSDLTQQVTPLAERVSDLSAALDNALAKVSELRAALMQKESRELQLLAALANKDVCLKNASVRVSSLSKALAIHRRNNTVLNPDYELQMNKKVCPGDMLLLRNYVSDALGSGGFGVVGSADITVTTATGKSCLLPVAVKMPKTPQYHSYLELEYRLLTGTLAPVECVVNPLGKFCVKVSARRREANVDPSRHQFAMVMPRFKGTMLEAFAPILPRYHLQMQVQQRPQTSKREKTEKHWKFDPLPPPCACRETACAYINWASKQLHRALRDMHCATKTKGHNDISLQNVMIDGTSARLEDHKLVLIDFGLFGKGWQHGLRLNAPYGWFSQDFGSKFTSIHTDYFQALMCIIALMMEQVKQVHGRSVYDWKKLTKEDTEPQRSQLGQSYETAHKRAILGHYSNGLGWTSHFMQHSEQQCTQGFHQTLCMPLREYWSTDANKVSIETLDKLFSPPYGIHCTEGKNTESDSRYEDVYDLLCLK